MSTVCLFMIWHHATVCTNGMLSINDRKFIIINFDGKLCWIFYFQAYSSRPWFPVIHAHIKKSLDCIHGHGLQLQHWNIYHGFVRIPTVFYLQKNWHTQWITSCDDVRFWPNNDNISMHQCMIGVLWINKWCFSQWVFFKDSLAENMEYSPEFIIIVVILSVFHRPVFALSVDWLCFHPAFSDGTNEKFRLRRMASSVHEVDEPQQVTCHGFLPETGSRPRRPHYAWWIHTRHPTIQ